MVLNSTNLIAGLSPSAPIFITIDNFRLSDLNDLPPDDQKKRLQALEQYTVNLHNTFLTSPRVHIIASVRHLHIGGSVVKVMNLVERHFPTVRICTICNTTFPLPKNSTTLHWFLQWMSTLTKWTMFYSNSQTCGGDWRNVAMNPSLTAIQLSGSGNLPKSENWTCLHQLRST